MPSSWGNSWGKSWGNSWGIIVEVEDTISKIKTSPSGYGYRNWDDVPEVRGEYVEGVKLEGSPADINHQIMLFLKIFFQLCV